MLQKIFSIVICLCLMFLSINSYATSCGGFFGNLEGDVTGDITGNAATATILETARTIAGVSFDGSENITIDMDDMADGSTNAAITLAQEASYDAVVTDFENLDMDDLADGSTNAAITLVQEASYDATVLDLENLTMDDLVDGSVNTAITLAQEASYDAVVTSVEGLDMDDLSDGSTNAAITLTQEASYDLAYDHISSDGSDHSFIDQSVTIASTPTFIGLDISDDIDVSGDVSINGVLSLADASDSSSTIDGAIKYNRIKETLEIGDGTNTRAIYTDGGIVFIIDGGGSAITTGAKSWIPLLKSGTITGYDFTCDTSATIVADVWTDTYANFPPDNSDAMPGGGKEPTITAGVKAQDTDISDWSSVTVTKNNYIRINIDSNDNATYAVLYLKVRWE